MKKIIIALMLFVAAAAAQGQKLLVNGWKHGSAGVAQNLLIRSEQMDLNGSFGDGWDINNGTITTNQANDGAGNATLERISLTTSGDNRHRQVIGGLTAGVTYYFSFEVALPSSGAVTNLFYSVYDFSNTAEIIAPTTYFSSVSTTVTRVTFSFTTPAGCTQVGVYTSRDTPSTGDYFVGRAWLYTGTGKIYATTTTTIIP